MRVACISLCIAGAFGSYVAGPLASTPRACRRRAPAAPLMAAADLLKVSHAVDDVDATAAFYTACLGLESSEVAGGAMLSAPGDASGLSLELQQEAGASWSETKGWQGAEGAGYQGLMARVPSVADACATAVANGGKVLREIETVNHGASMMPEENEELDNPVVEALVADPSGFPLLLHECDGAEAACLSGARLSVYEWKKSQEWYEKLGLQTVRWNSNVHREASLTITLGAAAADPPVGPRGHLPPSSAPVLQLMYIYGAPPVEVADCGLRGITIGGGEAAKELSDPDAYKVVLQAA